MAHNQGRLVSISRKFFRSSLTFRRKHYVNAIVEKLPAENLHLNTKIVGITPHESSVTLIEDNGTRHEYDYVILA